MKDPSEQKGDQISIRAAAGGSVAAGKNISQTTIIYQNSESKGLNWFQKLTLPFWINRVWQRYCRNLAQNLSEQEGVDREFSELMAVLPPSDLPIRYKDREYSLSDIIETLRLPRVIILGEPGSGKSTSVRHLAMIQARKAAANPRKAKIPILAPLDTYTGGDIVAFLQDKVTGFKSGELSYLLPRYLQEGKMIIFFDALNEMPGDQFQHNIRLIQKAVDDNPRNRFVFTCRTEQYKGELEIPRAVLQPLDDSLIEDFIVRYKGTNGTVFYNRLKSGSLLPLVRNPFFLWMVLRIGEVPESKGDLIEQFVDTLFQREESKGDVYRAYASYPVSALKGILAYLAFHMMMRYRSTVISVEESSTLLWDIFPPKENSDFVQQGCDTLVLRFSDARKRNFGFWHQIIQEYFAAVYLDRQLKDMKDAELEALIFDPRWWETVSIWVGISNDVPGLITRVLGDAAKPGRVIFANALFYNSEQAAQSPAKKQLTQALCRLLETGLHKDDINLILNINELVGSRFFFEPCQAFLDSLTFDPDAPPIERAKQLKSLQAVIETAGKLGGTEAVRVLFQIYAFDAYRHRQIENKVVNGLITIGKPAVLPVFSLILFQRSGRLPASVGADIPYILVQTPIPTDTCFAIIGNIGEPAIDVLEEQMEQNAGDLEMISLLLLTLRHTPETPRSCRLIGQWLGHEDGDLNRKAIKTLQTIADVHAIALLGEILQEKNLFRKLAAIDVLGQLDSIKAVELLEKAAKDPSEAIRSQAALYLRAKSGSSSDLQIMQERLMNDPLAFGESYRDIFERAKRDVEDEIRAGIASSNETAPQEKSPPGERAEMTFLEHLEELRLHLLRSTSAFWVTLALIAVFFGYATLPALNWFYGPAHIPEPSWYFYLPNLANLAVFLSFPYFLYEAWRFTRPGLYPEERRLYGRLLLLALVVLAGITAGIFLAARYAVLLPDLATGAPLRVYLINKLGLALIVAITVKLIVRMVKKNPVAYDVLFSFVVTTVGEFAVVLFGRERLTVLRYRLGRSFKQKLRSKTLRGILTLALILGFIAIPIHFYLPLMVVAVFLIVSSGNTTQAIGPIKQLGDFIRSRDDRLWDYAKNLVGSNVIRPAASDTPDAEDDADTGPEENVLLNHVLKLVGSLLAGIAVPILISVGVSLLYYREFIAALSRLYTNAESLDFAVVFSDYGIRFKVFWALLLFASILLVPLLAFQWFKKGLSSNNKKIAGTLAVSLMAIPILAMAFIHPISGFVAYKTELAHVDLTNKLAASLALILVNFTARYFLTVFGVLETLRHIFSLAIILMVCVVWLWPFWLMALVTLAGLLYLGYLYYKLRKKIIDLKP